MARGNGKAIGMPSAAINVRILAALSLFSSKDESKYMLQGVCIEVDERSATYVGTDGHRLIAYRDELAPDETDNTVTGTFIIPAPYCKLFKLDKEDEGRGRLFIGPRLTIAHSLLDITFVPIEGVYPDWRKSLPKGKASGVTAQFNLKYLADLHKICKALDLGQPFIAPNGDAPAFVWFSGHKHVLGVIMPIKAIDQMDRGAPQWARRGPEREQGDVEDLLLTYEEDDVDPETGELSPKAPRLLPKPDEGGAEA